MDIFASIPSVPSGHAVNYSFSIYSSRFPNISPTTTDSPRLHLSQPNVLNGGEFSFSFLFTVSVFISFLKYINSFSDIQF